MIWWAIAHMMFHDIVCLPSRSARIRSQFHQGLEAPNKQRPQIGDPMFDNVLDVTNAPLQCVDASDAEIAQSSGGVVGSCSLAKASGLCGLIGVHTSCRASCGSCIATPTSQPTRNPTLDPAHATNPPAFPSMTTNPSRAPSITYVTAHVYSGQHLQPKGPRCCHLLAGHRCQYAQTSDMGTLSS